MKIHFTWVLLIIWLGLFPQNKHKNINSYNSNKKPHGRWIYFYNKENNKVQSKGRYRNGNPVGQWIMYYEDGSKYIKKRYFRKKTHEVWYFPNGKIESRGWSKLLLDDPVEINYYWDGKWRFYNENGKLTSILVYSKGIFKDTIKDVNAEE